MFRLLANVPVRRARLHAGALQVFAALGAGWAAPASAAETGLHDTFGDYELLQECQPLYNTLQQLGADFTSAKRAADRALRQTPTCGYVFARFLRTNNLLNDAAALTAADDALKATQGELLSTQDGYAYFLKEAILTGQSMPGSSWNSQMAANLTQLENFPASDEFKSELFAGCMRFAANPLSDVACNPPEFMPTNSKDKVAEARRARDALLRACAFNEPTEGAVGDCSKEIDGMRSDYPAAAPQLAAFETKLLNAKEKIAFRDILRVCAFSSGSDVAARIGGVKNCAAKLKGQDSSKEPIQTASTAMLAEVAQLEHQLNTETGTLPDRQESCKQREELEKAAAGRVDVPPIAVCSKLSNVNLDKLAKLEKSFRVGGALPPFATNFEKDCLAAPGPAPTYIAKCAKELSMLLTDLMAPKTKAALADLQAFPPAPPQPIPALRPGQDAAESPQGAPQIASKDLLGQWADIERDKELLPKTTEAIERAASDLARVSTEGLASQVTCARPEKKGTAAAVAPGKVLKDLGSLLSNERRAQLDKQLKDWVQAACATAAAGPQPETGAAPRQGDPSRPAGQAAPSPRMTAEGEAPRSPPAGAAPATTPPQTAARNNSVEELDREGLARAIETNVPPPAIPKPCKGGGSPLKRPECIQALQGLTDQPLTKQVFRENVRLTPDVVPSGFIDEIVKTANALLRESEQDCRKVQTGVAQDSLIDGLRGLAELLDDRAAELMEMHARAFETDCLGSRPRD